MGSRAATTFHICTVANDAAQYTAMKESFFTAGFDTSCTRYTGFLNGPENAISPSKAYNLCLDEGGAEIVICCHQDIRLDRGDGAAQLRQRLAELEQACPRWSVAGNAGVTRALTFRMHISDPHGNDRLQGPLPARVQSLDENLLIIRGSSGVRFTPGLTGFHLYGSDICLNAERLGQTCHVIDFHLSHLSGGSRDAAFAACKQAFVAHWAPAFTLRYYRTMADLFVLSRWPAARKLFGAPQVLAAIEDPSYLPSLPARLLRRFTSRGRAT